MLQLLIFIFLTFLLVLLPFCYNHEEEASNLLRKFHFPKKLNILYSLDLRTTIKFLLNMLEFMLYKNFLVKMFWTSGFISWVIGCSLWVLNIDFFSSIFIFVSSIFCLITIFKVINLDLHEASASKMFKPKFSPYILIISVSVLTMVVLKSVAIGLTTSILLMLFLYDWRLIKQSKVKI